MSEPGSNSNKMAVWKFNYNWNGKYTSKTNNVSLNSFLILEFEKVKMHGFWYKYVKPKDEEKVGQSLVT